MRFPENFSLKVSGGQSFCARQAGEVVLKIENGICELHTVWAYDCPRFKAGQRFVFRLEGGTGDVELAVEKHRVRLYSNDILTDEEWPQGYLPQGEWDTEGEYTLLPLRKEERAEYAVDSAWGYCPEGRNTGVGDCMPFYRDGRYCVYYLFDRRGHHSKGGLGAHQWTQISTDDLKHWVQHPMAVGIDEMNEASICTGSLISHDGLVSAFYAVRTTDGTPARLTRADSCDGVNFVKSDMCVSLTEPYEPVSARDPMVFQDEDGLYHMLVTTELTGVRRGGCLAHLTSPDLEQWTQHAPFIVPGYGDQPECSDYFKWGDIYYLVFSNHATARYRMSESPFGPWAKPEYDVLDSVESAVCKTAAFGDRRLVTGFLNRLPRAYAGNMITHELFRRADGTLGSRFVSEMLPEWPMEKTEITLQDGEFSEVSLGNAKNFRLKADLKPCENNAVWEWGVILKSEDGEHKLVLDRTGKTALFCRAGESFFGPQWRNMLMDLPEMNTVEMIVKGDILDIALGGGRVMTVRLENANVREVCLYTRGRGAQICVEMGKDA